LLVDRRPEVLAKCRSKTMLAFGSRPTSADLDIGLPTLYEELVEVLRMSLESDSSERRSQFVQDTITAGASRQHAKEAY
ncbi:hypothetical protein ABTA57_19880, partial [Acinetobacter baumannii]